MNFQKKRILAIVPARGGSKGIPRKNIKFLAGKPLIAYTIRVALESKYLDGKVFVSTEDKEIAKISKKYGAKIVKRPQKLATDNISSIDVVLHALKFLKKEEGEPDIAILLNPTSPLRTATDIDKEIELFLRNKCESVIGVCESESSYWALKIKKGFLIPVFGKKYFETRRQDLPKVYIPNGVIFISTPKILNKYKTFYTNKILPFIMPLERSVDIDNEIDFKLVETIIKNQNEATELF